VAELQADYEEKTSKSGEILEYLIRPALPFYRICLRTTLTGQEMITEMLPPRSCNVHGWRIKDGLYAEAKVVAKISDPDFPRHLSWRSALLNQNMTRITRLFGLCYLGPKII
jgi:hypothetical protein